MAERSKNEMTFDIEAKAHIQLFHQYFFNLPPDDEYIKWTLGKAMYMADGTAMKQKQAMDENGFYSDIISSSAVCTIICDSIKLDENERKFTYYGTQFIKRRSRDLKRSIVTVGELENVPRTENNPHGLLIVNWRTLENKDLDY
jgi:conjugative transposon TraK protein